MPHFECGAFNHSATSPKRRLDGVPSGCGAVLCEVRAPDKAGIWGFTPAFALPPPRFTLRPGKSSYGAASPAQPVLPELAAMSRICTAFGSSIRNSASRSR
jgi:hypothetical protein